MLPGPGKADGVVCDRSNSGTTLACFNTYTCIDQGHVPCFISTDKVRMV